MIDASKGTSVTLNQGANMFTYKLVQVDGDGSFFPASEDEVIGVEHLLAEPKCNKDLVDGVLGFDAFNPQKCFDIVDFSRAVQYDQTKIDSDAQDSNLTQGETTKEFIDGMLRGTDDGVLHGTNYLPSTCEDYLLDTELADKVSDLDYDPSEGSCLENLGLESHSPGFNERHCGDETSELATASIPVLESTYDQNMLDKMTIYELHEAFRNMFGRETSVKDKQWLKRRILFGLQNLVDLDSGVNLLECGVPSNDNEGKMISSGVESSGRASSPFTGVFSNRTMTGDLDVKRERLVGCDPFKTLSSEVSKAGFCLLDSGKKEGALVTQKRLRKPTRRYIEESLEQKSKYYRRKCKVSYTSSRDKFLRVTSHKQHCQKGFRATSLVCREKSFGGACIQVPFSIPVRKGRVKKNTSLSGHESEDFKNSKLLVPNENSDMEPFIAESQDDVSEDDHITRINTQKGKSRRKHHRLWTLSEVMKLIDGVTKYGVGRWTEIKRLLFSSSAHRTSVDLKDKWRNLLRASCAQLQSKREVEQGRKHASQPIPQSVLRRVRELAIIYPYPRERKSKVSCTAPVTSPIHVPTSNNLVPLSTAVRW